MILSILLVVSFSAHADTWEELQSLYFKKLNFRVNQESLREIPVYAYELSKYADSVRADIHNREEAGLVFIYDALMLMNLNKGVGDGSLQLEDLRQHRSYAPVGAGALDELKARAEFAHQELIEALRLRPDDQRILSWIAGAKHGRLVLENDGTVQKSLREALDSIPLRPTFNLWSAILIFRNHSADSDMYGELASAGKTFVNHLGDSTNPCVTKPQDCENGIKAEYNIQSSLVTLGDTFLRRAEFLLDVGRIGEAMELLSYSQGTYKQLFSEKNIEHTNSWSDKDVITERMEYVAEMFKTRKPRKLLLNGTSNFARPYECASCHGR